MKSNFTSIICLLFSKKKNSVMFPLFGEILQPANILLSASFEAKLSDFGLSKIISIGHSYASSEVRGTYGYVDPEYQKNRHVNSYGDVYSFGIVLLQLLSGQRVINLDLKNPMPLSKMVNILNPPFSCIHFKFFFNTSF